MHNTFTFPPLESSEVEGNPTFNVVIVYEDLETGKHAKKIYDYLVEHLGDECVCNNQMWKFDVLAVPKLRDMAVKDAAIADIIIVSARETEELPAGVKSWIHLWLAEKPTTLALVALFQSAEETGNRVRDFLAETARAGQMEFFSRPGFWPEPQQGQELSVSRKWRHDKTFSVLAGVIQQDRMAPVSHWGINE